MELPLKLVKRYEQSNKLSEGDVTKKLEEVKVKNADVLDEKEQVERRRKMIASVSVEAYEDAFERYIGNNDLLPTNYLQLGVLRSKSVGRIYYKDLERNKFAMATGFLISGNLVMTNHHVFSDPAKFSDAIIEFDYEYDIFGKEKPRTTFALDVTKFFYANEKLDMAIIGVQQKDITGASDIRERGYLVLNETRGKIGIGDFACIIQHPEGKPQMVGLRENKVLDISDPEFIVYSTDTTVGSSGGPVMNDQWQIIALHSAGVPRKNAQGQYLDKNNQPIEPVDGRIDSTRVDWISNRGSKISAIINELRNDAKVKDKPYILELFSPSYSDDKNLVYLSYPKESVPVVEIKKTSITETKPAPQNVHIHINLGDSSKTFSTLSNGHGAVPALTTLDTFEKKYEDGLDFSSCNGFDEYFLGDHTPLPRLNEKLKKKIATHVDNPNRYVLKYHHYSTVHHAVRRQPVYAAINITGLKRYAALDGRSDKWFRDNRIDYDVQLNDEFYKYSGFDRGHLCRREEAEWGNTMAFAELAANLTCSYTNACPQVPTLNRAKYGAHGMWGRLEIEILEKGVAAKNEDERKIVVYNGPIFHEDDPVFKGVQIPLHFWKVVVWRNPDGKLNTTAFILHQDRLVEEIEFELAYDQVFRNNHCSIAYLEKLTGLSFDKIKAWDTYVPTAEAPEERLIVPDGFEKIVLLPIERTS
jgi:endonuclease G